MKQNKLLDALHNFERIYNHFETAGFETSRGSIILATDNLLYKLLAYKAKLLPVDNNPLPPPNWQAVHIGDGIFVEMENPELNCEVG